jgi:hypothetical protein
MDAPQNTVVLYTLYNLHTVKRRRLGKKYEQLLKITKRFIYITKINGGKIGE